VSAIQDVVQPGFGPRLQRFRQVVQDVGGLVHPAALRARLRENLLERSPKSERTVADREIRRELHSALLQLAQQIKPALLRFAHAVLNGQKALLPALIDAD
jgi:hypothetical protein